MRVLIPTQKVDKNDGTFCFFHRWASLADALRRESIERRSLTLLINHSIQALSK